MTKQQNKLNRIIELFAVPATIVIMVLASELLGEKEIIFPEIAALALGFFLAPKQPWETNATRTLVFISLCAFLGVGIVSLGFLPLWAQLTLAFIIGQLVYMFSRTGLAPMISAIALPVLMQSRGLVYPLSALALTAYVLLKRRIFEEAGIKEKREFSPLPMPAGDAWKSFGFRTVVGAVIIFAAVNLNAKFCVAPPLLVAFTELCRPECPAGKRKSAAVLLVFLCAAAGALSRYGLVILLGFSPVIAAGIIAILIVAFSKLFKLYFPPAGALAVLPLLIAEEAVLLYSAEVFSGMLVLTTAAALWTKRKIR